ncbi:hypothetical protein SteCoe_4568 [Stentor coeruleus]|uniref:EF-hand domain-containing protein n=1 Tax=Stentor coeruleus TaxID=5963 RepID=A0A1R2CUI8_9CILI|nr:hypothetical protein SteCoe_4568 [Stentor coeruleus]
MEKYHEPSDAITKLFRALDIVFFMQNHDSYITIEDLSLAFKSIHLRPPLKEIKAILGQAGTLKLNFQQFQTLRLSKKRCELNVVADFKKFEDKQYKGYITQKSIEDALFTEGHSRSDITYITNTLMKIDRNHDGFITYKELYNFLMGTIPEDWIRWLVENADCGVSQDLLISMMQDNGFNGKAVEEFLNTYLDIKAKQ